MDIISCQSESLQIARNHLPEDMRMPFRKWAGQGMAGAVGGVYKEMSGKAKREKAILCSRITIQA